MQGGDNQQDKEKPEPQENDQKVENSTGATPPAKCVSKIQDPSDKFNEADDEGSEGKVEQKETKPADAV